MQINNRLVGCYCLLIFTFREMGLRDTEIRKRCQGRITGINDICEFHSCIFVFLLPEINFASNVQNLVEEWTIAKGFTERIELCKRNVQFTFTVVAHRCVKLRLLRQFTPRVRRN